MADQSDYTAVASALLTALQTDINENVPAFERGMIPADLPGKLATSLAKTAVDALDAHRAQKS